MASQLEVEVDDPLIDLILEAVTDDGEGGLVTRTPGTARGSAMYHLMRGSPTSTWPAIAAAGYPVLLLLATVPDETRAQNEPAATRFGAAIPHADVRLLTGVAHSINTDLREELGTMLVEWLGRPPALAVGTDDAQACRWHDAAVAELQFFTGTMDCGKSTLALQMDHNHAARGRVGRIFTSHDRAGESMLSSRLGLSIDAIEVTADFNFWHYVVDSLTSGGRIDYLVCDEAQFYTPDQIDQLARLVDDLQIDVFAFGILTDFRTQLFPGSARLVELADRVNVLQVEALCWCGERATHNARTENGEMVVEGEVIVVGDVEQTRRAAARRRLRGAVPAAPPAPDDRGARARPRRCRPTCCPSTEGSLVRRGRAAPRGRRSVPGRR